MKRMRCMKILLYGFKPFGDYSENISERVVRGIKPRRGLVKVVFPVAFNRSLYSRAFKRMRPDVILGIGQCGAGRRIRIERTAHGKRGRFRHVTLKLRPDAVSRISYDAGNYVCNFSMMTMLESIRGSQTEFAFIHIPKSYNLRNAITYIERRLDAIVDRRGS
jgi:pyrrolidone-carboxylate peptidase